MQSLDSFFEILDKRAPLELDKKLIERGDYDNSGIIVRVNESVERVLFSLDLSEASLKKAVTLCCDTIVTHHPAIYKPIKSLSCGDYSSRSVLAAARRGINVISMHLNLDVAEDGIDASLCMGLGGEEYKILDMTDEKTGYGREFSVKKRTLSEMKACAKMSFCAKRLITYGNPGTEIKTVASFCGGGSGSALSYLENGGKADLIVTSDMPHHVIKEALERGVCVMLLTHYASENYGFNRYYEKITRDVEEKVKTFFFTDGRFM